MLLKENDLYVKQVSDYYTDETINEGKVSFDKSKGVYISWNKNYDISELVFPIPVDKINAGFGVTQNEEWPNVMPK